MAASYSTLLLLLAPRFLLDKHIESVSSFIRLSRAWFASDPVAMVSAPAWSWTCVYCIYYGMLRKERADLSAGALWVPHSSVWDVVCFFFFMQGNCLLFSEKRWEQEAIWRDGHHNSNSNWMGCTASAQWAQACGQITRACLLYVIPMKMWLWRWNINHDQLGIHRIHIPVIKFITWSSRQRFVLRKHLSKQQEKLKKSLASSLRKYWPQTISASMENNTINN